MTSHTFTRQSIIPTTIEQMQAFHEQPDAIKHLIMPPLIVQINRDTRTSITAGEIAFTLWFGPIPVKWLARHEVGPIATSFRDVQVHGPHARWEHDHVFESVAGGVRLTDRISIEHKPGWRGWLTRLFFDGPLLAVFFGFRHWQTRRLLAKSSDANLDAASKIS